MHLSELNQTIHCSISWRSCAKIHTKNGCILSYLRPRVFVSRALRHQPSKSAVEVEICIDILIFHDIVVI